MLDWENLRHLAALAKGGSLSAAARLLDVEHATVARRIAALETALSVRVVDRRGRKLLLTAEGARVALSSRDISGTVTLSGPPAYAAAALVVPLTRL